MITWLFLLTSKTKQRLNLCPSKINTLIQWVNSFRCTWCVKNLIFLIDINRSTQISQLMSLLNRLLLLFIDKNIVTFCYSFNRQNLFIRFSDNNIFRSKIINPILRVIHGLNHTCNSLFQLLNSLLYLSIVLRQHFNKFFLYIFEPLINFFLNLKLNLFPLPLIHITRIVLNGETLCQQWLIRLQYFRL